MFVSHKALNVHHLVTDFFRQGEEHNCLRMVEEEVRAGTATDITAYGIPLFPVSSLYYLGVVLSTLHDDLFSVVSILLRA